MRKSKFQNVEKIEKKQNFEILIFYWLFRRFFFENLLVSKNIFRKKSKKSTFSKIFRFFSSKISNFKKYFSKKKNNSKKFRFQNLKINFRHENLIFFIQIFSWKGMDVEIRFLVSVRVSNYNDNFLFDVVFFPLPETEPCYMTSA